jgi:hypothetical protein
MTPEELERARLESARALEEAAEATRGDAIARSAGEILGGAPVVSASEAPRPVALPPAWNPPPPPDLSPVNESWNSPSKSTGLANLVKSNDAQVKFNSDQVQLDNALVAWIGGHFEATHRHYDRLIAEMQQRLDDVDTRHRGLEKELVRHVHEMARRIDVVLGEGEKGRVSHEAALRALRERLRDLDEKLR